MEFDSKNNGKVKLAAAIAAGSLLTFGGLKLFMPDPQSESLESGSAQFAKDYAACRNFEQIEELRLFFERNEDSPEFRRLVMDSLKSESDLFPPMLFNMLLSDTVSPHKSIQLLSQIANENDEYRVILAEILRGPKAQQDLGAYFKPQKIQADDGVTAALLIGLHLLCDIPVSIDTHSLTKLKQSVDEAAGKIKPEYIDAAMVAINNCVVI